MERTNIRNVTSADIGEKLDFISIDVAFISLTKVLPVAKDLLQPEGELVALIKPQFEAGREHVGKKGVVKDPEIHRDVINKIVDFARSLALVPLMATHSPIKGPEGNIEYLLYLSKQGQDQMQLTPAVIDEVVQEAHQQLM
jgi:23S rRNA (cytidine1920-2'-O)/16S rRNA (cytidine1409-2'-O)-methyltransferase